MRTRTIEDCVVDVDALSWQMARRGWNAERLVAEAGLTRRTAKRVFGGRPIGHTTQQKLIQALGVLDSIGPPPPGPLFISEEEAMWVGQPHQHTGVRRMGLFIFTERQIPVRGGPGRGS